MTDWHENIKTDSKPRRHPETPFRQQLAVGIRTYRKQLKLSQSELADMAGTTQATIVKLENGRGNPTLGIIIRVFDALGRDPLMMWREK